jgi:hypothetical protein
VWSADNRVLDRHPPDIIRLHLAIGVIETLIGLSAKTRSSRRGNGAQTRHPDLASADKGRKLLLGTSSAACQEAA